MILRRRQSPAALAFVCALSFLACKERGPPVSAEAGVYRFGPPPPKTPQRIVSLAPNMTEILFAIGAGPRVVGVTRFCDFPEAAKAIPKVGGFLDISVEAVAAQRPDLVVGVPNATNRSAIESLAQLKIPVLLFEAHRLGEVYTLIGELGAAADRRAEATRLAMSMRMRVAETRANVQFARKVPVLFAYGRDPLIVAGPGSFAGELVDLAGGINVVKEEGPRYRTYNIERVLTLAPEVLIDSSMAPSGEKSNDAALYERWSRFPSLPAVKNKRLHWVDPQLFARPGPRLVEALEKLSAIFHPKVVAGAPRVVVPDGGVLARYDGGAPAGDGGLLKKPVQSPKKPASKESPPIAPSP